MSIIIPLMRSKAVGTSVNLKNGLIGCWEMDETSGTTVFDIHGSNHLTKGTAVTINQTGKISQCYSYNGSSTARCTLASATAFAGLPAVTVAAWCRLAAIPSPYGIIISKLHSSWVSPNYQFQLRTYSTNMWNFCVGSATAFTTATFTGAIALNTWYHIIGTYDGASGTAKVYINNVAGGTIGTVAGAGNIGSAASPLVLGDDSGLFANFKNWNGLIDQTAVWDRVLNSLELQALYNSGNGLAYSNW